MSKIPKAVAAPWAFQAHKAALGEQFARCANCVGTTGKVADGKMGCSRAGATVVMVTPTQAKECDGSKPVFLENAWPLKAAVVHIGQLSAA